MKVYLTAYAVAQGLQVSKETFRQWLQANHIPHIARDINGTKRYLIRPEDALKAPIVIQHFQRQNRQLPEWIPESETFFYTQMPERKIAPEKIEPLYAKP